MAKTEGSEGTIGSESPEGRETRAGKPLIPEPHDGPRTPDSSADPAEPSGPDDEDPPKHSGRTPLRRSRPAPDSPDEQDGNRSTHGAGRGTMLALVAGALGVVFGDIGTSPLYALQTVFSSHHNAVAPTEGDVLGVISMVTWCLITIVSVTYIGLIMRADNQGEGGVLALTALILRKLGATTGRRKLYFALVLGSIGAALFFGDSLITPAISVLSAFEGIEVADAAPNSVILPGAVIVLTLLFAVQRWGTGKIGRYFGAVMIIWFVTIAAMGLPHVVSHPSILRAVSPHYAFAFIIDRPVVAFIAMGAVVLTITGAEALYADMGHFGRKPIVLAWTCLVLPALLLNYYGQGALILGDPATVVNPFFSLVPDGLRLPLVALAAMATVIASQAVISGAFSVSRQATRLSLLPRLKVTQTSPEHGGQIYVGVVNIILFLGVLTLVLVFRESEKLASAYGLAVTATIILVLALFLLYALHIRNWPKWRVALMAVVVGGLELILLAANVVKIPSGGWLPLVIAAILTTIMLTWKRGSKILFGRRREMEGPLSDFVSGALVDVHRVPGVAVYPHGDPTTVPLALRTGVELNKVLHEHVVIVTIAHAGVPRVPAAERVLVDTLGDDSDGIAHVTYRVGFLDSQDVPQAVHDAAAFARCEAPGRCAPASACGEPHDSQCSDIEAPIPELLFDPDEAIYYLSVFRIEPGHDRSMPRWQKVLFRILEKASANRTQVLHLPPTRTIVMGAETVL